MGCTQAKPSSHAKKNQKQNQNHNFKQDQQKNVQEKKSAQLNSLKQDISKGNQKNMQTNFMNKNQNNQYMDQNKSEYKKQSQVQSSKLQNPQINIHKAQSEIKTSQMMESDSQIKIKQEQEKHFSNLDINQELKSKLSSNKNIEESASLQIQSFKRQGKQQPNSNLQSSFKKSLVSASQKKQNAQLQVQKGGLNQTAFVNNKNTRPNLNQRMIQSTGKLLQQKTFKNNYLQNKNKNMDKQKQNQIDESSKQDTFSTEIRKQKHSLLMGNPKMYDEDDKIQDVKVFKKDFQSVMEKPKNFEERFNNNRKNSLDLKEKNNIKNMNLNDQEPSQRIEGEQGIINKVAQSSVPNRINKNNTDQMNQSQNNLSNSKYMKQMQNKIITQVEQEKYSSHQQNNHRSSSHYSISRGQSGKHLPQKQMNKSQKKINQSKTNPMIPQIHLDQSHYSTKPDPRVNIILFESKNSNQSKKTVSKFNHNNLNNLNNLGVPNQNTSPKNNQYSNLSMNQSRMAKQKLDDFSINSDYVLDEEECRYSMGMSKCKIQVQI